MNRITNAVKKGRCVFLLSAAHAQTPEGKKLSTLYPVVSLDGSEESPYLSLNAEGFTAANQNAGIIVMVEPNIFDSSFSEFAKVYSKLEKSPLLFLIAKSFNRFGLPTELQFKNIQHLKVRGSDLISELCKKSTEPGVEKKGKSSKPVIKAPSAILIGREEETKTLTEALQTGERAIFIHGPSGIGKHWLLEEAITKLETPVRRVPEIQFGQEIGLDTFLSRIAIAAPPQNQLMKALNARVNRPNPKEIARIVVEVLNSDEMKDTLFVVSAFENLLDDRDHSFYKERALELVLIEILKSPIKAKFVCISEKKLQTHTTENQACYIELLGINEENWKNVFETWHLSPEHLALALKFAHRTKGHPIAMRSLAVSIQSGLSEELLEQSKRGLIEDIHNPNEAKKLIQKMFDKLSNDHKDMIGLILLFARPVTADWLQRMLQIDRKSRISLIAAGLLEKTHTDPKRYYVHPLIQNLRFKPPSFKKMKELGLSLLDEAKMFRNREKNILEELCLIQTANNILSNAREPKLCWRTSVSCIDHILTPLRRVTFKQRKYDIAEKMLNSALRQSPAHPDALLIEHFLFRKKSGTKTPSMDEIHKKSGTPETYHYEATLFVERGQLDRAAKALEQGIKAFPQNARLCRRLSGLYLRQAKIESAQKTLLDAVKIQPLMPDNYSFLGDVYTRLGREHWEKAELCFAKARELGGETPPLLVRNARLLRLKAISHPDEAVAHYELCKSLLTKALEQEPKNLGANITMATLLLDQEGDLGEIETHLKPFLKFKEHTESFIQKARFLARKKDSTGAHNSLNKAYKLSSDNHYAFYVRGEIFFADGELNKAQEAFKTALERCPSSGAERTMYEQSIERMKAFILTETQIENEAPTETELIEASGMGFRRDPGMVIRRKGDEELEEALAENVGTDQPIENSETAAVEEVQTETIEEKTTDS
jgi:tetratricopeptide (TPR) repeat protein